jgi:hypothetical protein
MDDFITAFFSPIHASGYKLNLQITNTHLNETDFISN